MQWTKLDRYNYELLMNIIRIKISGTNDPDLVDIMSEINRSDGRIYVEGRHYIYSDDYRIYTEGGQSFLELSVIEM